MFLGGYPEFEGVDACVGRECSECSVVHDASWSFQFVADDVAECAFPSVSVEFFAGVHFFSDDSGNERCSDDLAVGV